MQSRNDSKWIALKYLKEQIITCAMPPGSDIRVEEIAEHLDISKTPVREALQELQYENYITVIPRKKTTVSPISAEDLAYIYDARALIEQYVIGSLSEKRIAENRSALLSLRTEWEKIDTECASSENYANYLECDLHFHKSLIELCENPHLVRFCTELINKSQRFWYMALYNNHPVHVRDEHLQILDSLLAGDAATAASYELQHITASRNLSSQFC